MDGWSQRTAFVASEPPFPALPGSAAYFGWNLSPGHSTERTIGFSNGTRPADTGQAYPKDAHEQLPHFADLGDRGVIV
jgi:hypothetical protein